MNERVKVPIRFKPSPDAVEEKPPVVEAEPPVVEQEPVAVKESPEAPPVPPEPRPTEPQPERGEPDGAEDVEVWRDRALRLQAEMENFRKRQRRLAGERIAADRGRLLRNFLAVVDNLERALNADGTDNEDLRQGVEMTYRSMLQLLKQEGVERIKAKGQPFDPLWHEAVDTVSHQRAGVEPDTVFEVTQPGYRLDGRVLRPARVIVAT